MPVFVSKIKSKFLSTRWPRLDFFDLFFKQLPRFYRPEDKVLHSLVGLIFFLSLVMGAVNARFFHFTVIDFSILPFTVILGLIVLWCVGILFYARWPRLSLLLTSFSQSFLFLVVMCYVISWAITTPFPLIDHTLLKFDHFFQFSTLGLMGWTYHQPWLEQLFSFCYDTWLFQLLLTPLLLALFKDRVGIDRYFTATFLALSIGILIYYFFPTIAPAGILQSPFFSSDQHALVTRFYEVHHSLPITTYSGGLIAFPSFHVINALIVMYTWRRYAWVFLPLLLVNLFSVIATVALGYHYLTDVVAGFFIAFLSIKFANDLLRRFSR